MMDDARAKDIFFAALDLPPSSRNAYLNEACAGDTILRRAVDDLLAAHAAPPIFNSDDRAAPTTNAKGPILEKPGNRVGKYKLLERIGEGGFGEVWVAEQDKPVRRKVALKIVKAGMDTREVLARFEAERQALAVMDHPNVARVFDAGATDSGRPYFVMEHVPGVPITAYCDSSRMKIKDRLGLFIDICQAVQHAHQKGIIHRDLKPSNILVTLQDGKPVPKVIDFGIAKAAIGRLTERTLYTETGRLIGTPEYMSPEQAGVTGLDVDTRSDVYSLGVLLYQLLTGTLPFDAATLREAGYDGIARIIKEQEPPKPSTRVFTLATERVNRTGGITSDVISKTHDTDIRSLTKDLRGDLDWIVMRAMEKDRTRRYESASAFAADVRRHLTGEPVVAAPPSAAYRVKKFVKKHRGQVVAAMLVTSVLTAGIVTTSWQWRRAERAVIEQSRARKDADLQRQRANKERDASVAARNEAEELAKLAHQGLTEALFEIPAYNPLDDFDLEFNEKGEPHFRPRKSEGRESIKKLTSLLKSAITDWKEQRDAAEAAELEAENQRDAAEKALKKTEDLLGQARDGLMRMKLESGDYTTFDGGKSALTIVRVPGQEPLQTIIDNALQAIRESKKQYNEARTQAETARAVAEFLCTDLLGSEPRSNVIDDLHIRFVDNGRKLQFTIRETKTALRVGASEPPQPANGSRITLEEDFRFHDDVMIVFETRLESAQTPGGRLDGKQRVEASLREALAGKLADVGKHERASEHFRRSLDLRVQTQGPEHTDTLNVVLKLASSCLEGGDDAKAREHLEWAWRAGCRPLLRRPPSELYLIAALCVLLNADTPEMQELDQVPGTVSFNGKTQSIFDGVDDSTRKQAIQLAKALVGVSVTKEPLSRFYVRQTRKWLKKLQILLKESKEQDDESELFVRDVEELLKRNESVTTASQPTTTQVGEE